MAPIALPTPADPNRAESGLNRWLDAAADAGTPVETRARSLADTPEPRTLLDAAFGNSPFLTLLAGRNPEYTCDLLEKGPNFALEAALAALADLCGEKDGAALARGLRMAKARIALATALADIQGVWDLPRVTGVLSDFADRALDLAAAHLLRAAHDSGSLTLPDPADPCRGSGLIILGVGKLGGGELNYSSDIDIIVFYDPDRIQTDNPDGLQKTFVRLTQGIVRLMEERSEYGYVFRTDLRIRPDPGSTPIAMSTLAGETYYESIGQNWERAALIKARAVAGDIEAGNAFLDTLRPFIWRKNLDFAAIQDIHSIKRQINTHKGGAKIKLNGHNLKLGRGGIREIEFFAQTQQLIWGGRIPELRIRPTIPSIFKLVETGQVKPETAKDLESSYTFLRTVEHRLQMVNDEQTHSLPDDDAGVARIACFLGYDTADAFAEDMLFHLRQVETHYAALFEEAPALTGEGETAGNLVFTGGDVDPDTLKTITSLGFAKPEAVDASVRGWHHGRYRATRSTRARQLLTELMPVILKALGGTADPDTAFSRFDDFLAKLPAGIQLFSLFHSRPELLTLLAEIMGSAPRLAERLARRPQILDAVLHRDFFAPLPPLQELADDLNGLLARARAMEEVLDTSRRWAKERKFQVGAQILLGDTPPKAASHALSDIAEALLLCLYPRIKAEFAEHHGRFPDDSGETGIVTIAMGKLGSGELQPASDLDIVFIYDTPKDATASDGEKQLAPSQYYARLSQRIINAITAQTAEGRLYEMDMRLRPSGAAGPIASSFEAFDLYHLGTAWTWEHMALTRARVVTGPEPLRQKVAAMIHNVLTRPRDASQLVLDVDDMRLRIDQQRHTDFLWEMKYQRGTIVDVEFIAQYLQLRHAHDHPDILAPSTRQAIENARTLGLIKDGVATDLIEAIDLWLGLQAVLRLSISGRFDPDKMDELTASLMQTLTRVAGVPDQAALEDKIRTRATRVYAIYQDLIETPATKIRAEKKQAETGD